jgi:hypothetical protein
MMEGELNKYPGLGLCKGVSQTGGKGDVSDRVIAVQSLGKQTLKDNICIHVE